MSADLPALRLGFAGTPEFAVPALDALRKSHGICAVFTQPDRPAGRGQPLHESPVKTLATRHRLPLHQPASFKSLETLDTLRSLRLDILVVAAYGLILPPAALQSPKLGCINIHASLLPRWRGAAPIQRAVLAGDTKTGVTIMRMEAGLDTGPMLAVSRTAIAPGDTAGTLHDRLARLGGELIVGTLEELAAGTARQCAQPEAGITYAEKISKREALIDWSDAALRVVRRVRAFNPWPVAETKLAGAQLRLWDAELAPAMGLVPEAQPAPPGTVLRASDAGVDVACGQGAVRILRLQLAGRKPLAAREFIKAQHLDGARLTSL